MKKLKFNRNLYSKVALLKAAYNFIDRAYIHLDVDEKYYYVIIKEKNDEVKIDEDQFLNEILTQSVRHEIYKQTKDIRELMLARALATSVIEIEEKEKSISTDEHSENEILKDWFLEND